MSAELHDGASAELTDAAAYLERQRDGYGDRFIAAFDSARDFLVNYPRSGRSTRYGVRIWPVEGFPYDIVYFLRGDDVFIVAVAHHRRRPDYWRSRLR